MDAVAESSELFNAEDHDGMRGLMGAGYTYAEPMFPERRDADAHLDLSTAPRGRSCALRGRCELPG